nr:hypothetical protein BaRGS_012553 [Batillaria attramentaria]
MEGGQAQQQQQAQRPNTWSVIKTLAIRMIFIYFIASMFRRSPTTPANDSSGGGGSMRPSTNLFDKGTVMDMYVYVSEQEDFDDFANEDALFWVEKGLVYGDWTSGLNKFKKRKFHATANLLTGETEVHPDLQQKENKSSFEILSHWHPNLTINLLDDHSPWVPGSVPQPLDEYIEFYPGGNKYYPVIYLNDYWNLNSDYMPINVTTKMLNLSLTYSPISLFKWQMYAAQSMRNKWSSFLGSDFVEDSDEDQDSLKTAFLETSPYLLALTIVVSILHSVFEFLAFKNDIQFWRSRKSLEGLSVRSVFFNVFQSLIVLLYVMDNETNTVVKISIFIGLCIEIWKIHKVVNIEFSDALLTGFIMMTPQLFINYKLKSVAHLPWRMLTYKALNTFIDDIFAFVIKMPTLYRLGCLRDDVIFFIYLYQRWIYRVDPKRVNEFGTSQEMLENPAAAAIDSDTTGENGTPAIPPSEGGEETSPPKSDVEKKTD